ncbi:citrate lyase subunit beta-like protein: mitochondrial [Dinothrombium tinctorium]|uniref:Citramalyl-CoA lyase, mitochondrial n=1 Tax=Dinothrombium tinctorium TaxID=1965070 RepID=A0A3S3NR90_9ACAR|nr:citrate lyase subunit beta-like protein: mitochondrial [Dinothrombium tinctorium]RWS04571.1 citrate lyase subunit beta-like protein: mitochondrial [Dinothrombium tinctorium]RWS04763.1 citrate lyase subunit beta-like protein: mitochondrial [Dinothrombium tinctorium]
MFSLRTKLSKFSRLLKTNIRPFACETQLRLNHEKTNTEEAEEVLKKRFEPRRGCLYVPGHDEQKLVKSLGFDADCFIYDCEDGVALNKKEKARTTIAKHLQTIKNDERIAVRINSVGSGFAESDLEVLFAGEVVPKTVFLPKVDSSHDIDWFTEKLGQYLKKKKEGFNVNLVIYVESAKALLDLKDIIDRALELSEFNLFNLEALVFGSDDFCASIGANRTKDAKEILMARQQIVLTAKAYGLQAIDIVYIDYKDLEGLKEQALEGANMGYTGKQAIHPSQLPIIQEAFTPSEDKIKWAQELIKLYNEHQESGTGAFVFRGQMIDKPLLLQAKNIIDTAHNIRSSFIEKED